MSGAWMQFRGTLMSRLWSFTSTSMLVASVGGALTATPARADEPAGAVSDAATAVKSAPSSNAMVNLVRLLVAQGTITRENGEKLIAQAESEAAEARLAAAAAPSVAYGQSAAVGQSVAGGQSAAGSQSAAGNLPVPAFGQQYAAGNLAPPPQGTIRVPYIPQVVRDQIRDELKAEVLKQASEQGWASPGKAAPAWVHNVNIYGDMRLRSQSHFYSQDNSDLVPNFQQIVSGDGGTRNGGPVPLDLINDPIPLLNTRQNQYNLMRYRLRVGVDFNIGSKVKVGFMLGGGNDVSPVGSNVNLAGNFTDRNFMIHKAFIEAKPTDWWTVTAGRMANPFWSTEALFDNDLSFDGFAGQLQLSDQENGFADYKLVYGAFPLNFGGLNFPNTSNVKTAAPQRWQFSAQAEADFHFPGDILVRSAASYHHYVNVEGRPSEPCALYLGATECSSDGSAASFVQKGNTLSFIRRIVFDPTLPATTVQPQPQLLGLTQSFRILDALISVKVPLSPNTDVTFTGEYIRNLGFSRSNACRFGVAGQPVNNGGSGGNGNICDPVVANRTPYVGGNQGFDLQIGAGWAHPDRWGQWRVYLGYRYLESDAVLDAFTNDYFRLGGTNVKGFILGSTLGVYDNVTLGARWMSANEISGEPLALDVLQLDLNVTF